ncbi:MAG: bifunctional diaminohydroxyphosphoribosylaminopyrimidine deaminase/5-amino-6-(5-phosphoribosylamino)uracil reductase RibD [Alphaproteobacteria bacterium]|nr:MAG: bifunctional diaminohydroxyphosphoribosylaminopyrimidine deaminase/5-amino-6-(5-phosphoribosylamino)uracil reductase RibD [Alphaproteobacteria bacterium]
MTARDAHFMKMAIGLAARGNGTTWPNPSVGCVLVDFSQSDFPVVVGRGVTSPGGRPHAEVNALAMAGDKARGTTAYVSLEPCAHQGQTGPCAEALIAAGVGKVVCALQDPNPKVSGAGIAMLEKAGIPVELGLLGREAHEVAIGFLKRMEAGRPFVTAKVASSLDGKIATVSGKSNWITGPAARERGHMERAFHDAIMVGSTTAIVDDPMLTCRIAGLESRSPVRIVLDGRLRLPLTSKLVQTAREIPTWIVTLSHGDAARAEAFRGCGVEVIELPGGKGHHLDIREVLAELAARGLTRVLAEGGASLHGSLLKSGMVDRLLWFRAAKVIGGDGVSGVSSMGVDLLEDAAGFVRTGLEQIGDDCLETLMAVEV